jgi:hypothetical protein
MARRRSDCAAAGRARPGAFRTLRGASACYRKSRRQCTVWGAIPAYAEALDGALGAGALPRFQREVELALAEFSGNAKRFYENWMRVSGFPRSAHCQ